MKIKKITRTVELTVEKSERFAVSRGTFSNWCPVCENCEKFATPENAARRFKVKQREIFRLVERGDLGSVEPAEDLLLICLDCLNRIKPQL